MTWLGYAWLAVAVVTSAWLLRVARPTPAPEAPGAATGSKVENFSLLDQDGAAHELYRQTGAEGVVLVSYARACPIARGSLPAIGELRKKFAGKVRFFLIDPADSAAEQALEAKEFGIDLPLLRDETQLVSKFLGYERTAEAVLIRTSDWRVAYQGPIDDLYDYGSPKDAASKHYLKDAIAALSGGGLSPSRHGNVKGCLIRYEKPLAPAYAADVAPILKLRCLQCHAEATLGFPMSDYETVRKWAPMIRETVLTGRMPPWSVDPERSLKLKTGFPMSAREIRVLAEWIAADAPRGGGRDPLKGYVPPKPAEPPGPPDLELRPARQTIPASRTGETAWRYEELAGPFPEDRWVRLARLVPGNRGVVSHLRLMALPDDIEAVKRRWGSVEPMGLYQHNILATWVPGHEPALMPVDQGMLIPKGSRVVIGYHYKTTGKAESDQSTAALYFHKTKPKWRVRYHVLTATDFVLLPGAGSVPVRAEKTFPKGLVLRSVGFHMHGRGARARAEAVLPDGKRVGLVAAPRFDSSWRWGYFFSAPQHFPPGTRIVIEGVFDNSASNPRNPDPKARVTQGPNARTQEMFDGYLSALEPS
ncbi:MAG: redoxin domain-containing protein [Elusimicrobia bacterium]|nr:redoxin domain-containing protein [Elusimicrobiota bacterium]